jgi:hypothetical protein
MSSEKANFVPQTGQTVTLYKFYKFFMVTGDPASCCHCDGVFSWQRLTIGVTIMATPGGTRGVCRVNRRPFGGSGNTKVLIVCMRNKYRVLIYGLIFRRIALW